MSDDVWNSVFCISLLAVCWFDWRHGIIPNWLNLVLLCAGFVRVLFLGWSFVSMAVVAVAAAAGTFLLIRWLYIQHRGIDGLGLGDVKFIAAVAPWVGLAGLPTVLLASSLSGLMFVAGRYLIARHETKSYSLAFGPHLAIGAAVVWFAGPLGG